MYHQPLTRDQKRAYHRALRASTRTTQVKARLLAKDGKGRATPLHISDGEIIVDASDPQAPLETCHLTLYDPEHRFRLSRALRSSGDSWLAHEVQVKVGIWVFDLNGDSGDWVWTPEFTGPIVNISISDGSVVEIDCASRDIEHLPPAYFGRSFHVRRHTKIHKAVRAVASHRGVTKFKLTTTHKRLRKTKTWGRQGIPWKAMRGLANMLDYQLFFDGSGRLVVRDKKRHPVWVFQDEELLAYPEKSLSRSDLINQVVAIGGGERTRKDDQKRPVVARAKLQKGNPLSSHSLSDGKRPLILFRVYDNLKKRSDLKDRAKRVLKRKAHLDQETALSVRYVPGLQPLDVVKVRGQRIRLKRFTKPLNLNGQMDINWTSHRAPVHRKGRR